VNNSDFKCFLKVGREPLSLSWAGNEFHTVGTVTEKVRLPSSVRVRLTGVNRQRWTWKCHGMKHVWQIWWC